jgi:hypothetical protein
MLIMQVDVTMHPRVQRLFYRSSGNYHRVIEVLFLVCVFSPSLHGCHASVAETGRERLNLANNGIDGMRIIMLNCVDAYWR